MAHVTTALAVTTLLLALVGSVTAQDSSPCLSSGPYLLYAYCVNYLTDASATTPSAYCCTEVNDITTSYGTDCLCQIVLQGQANPTSGVIPGRAKSLATLCNSNADMSKCGTPASPPGAVTSPPPPPPSLFTSPPSIFLTPPPPPGGATPEFGVPSGPTASGSKGSKGSLGAIVGGSVVGGGISIMGLLYLLFRCLPKCFNININCDLNNCCCCHRRHDKPEHTTGGPVPGTLPHKPHPHVPPRVQRLHLGNHALGNWL